MVKKRRVTRKKAEIIEPAEIRNDVFEEKQTAASSSGFRSYLNIKNIILVLILLGVLFVWKFKNLFIAATVNGQPISRLQLISQLQKRFGDQVLDNMINERLILAAARQKGIFITSAEIDKRIKTIEDQLQGKMSLDEALKAQGLTKDEFRKQIEIQLSIDKMFEKEASVSSKDIDDYIGKNGDYYKNSTDPAALKEEVKSFLLQQKISDLFNKWFTDLRQKASINKYL